MKIFISYRRDDSAGYAGRLFDHLAARFGAQNIFMDIDTIEPGEDFRKVIENAVGTCDVVLVMIGKQWLSIADLQGQRRLTDPRDWVRLEIANALANSRVRVIPVLVRGAGMPGGPDLPPDLQDLAWRNAIELSDTRFAHDANRLIEVIERALGKTSPPPAAQVTAAQSTLSQKPKSRIAGCAGVVLGFVGLALCIWPAWYGVTAFPNYVEGDWLAFPIALVGIVLAVIGYRLIRK